MSAAAAAAAAAGSAPAAGSGEAPKVTVALRIRPKLDSLGEKYEMELVRKLDEETVLAIGYTSGVVDAKSDKPFQVDHTFDENSTQAEIYDQAAAGFVDATLKGVNATIFAYGQTGTGKTFTIGELPEVVDAAAPVQEHSGIVIRAIADIFKYKKSQTKINVRLFVSYLEIYQERLRDLLNPGKEGDDLQLRETADEVQVPGLTVYEVTKISQVYDIMRKGASVRATGTTKMNERSSRSHSVFMLTIEQWLGETLAVGSTLTLVDLAGSERIKKSKVEGERLKEATSINKSLSALGNVVNPMFYERPHVPYRDSKLTRMLKNSFTGACKTMVICTLAPTSSCYDESLSTLRFADRIKQIKPKGKGIQSHELELENLRLKRENDELSGELRIAMEAYGYTMQLDKLDAASPTWDDDVPKMIEKVKVLKERERKKTEQDRADALKKAAEDAEKKTGAKWQADMTRREAEIRAEVAQQLSSLTAESAATRGDADKLRADLEEARAQAAAAQASVARLEGEVALLSDARSGLERARDDLQRQREDRERALAEAQAKAAEAQQSTASTAAEKDALISALRTQNTSLSAELDALRVARDAVEGRAGTLDAEVAARAAAVAAAQGEAAGLRAQLEQALAAQRAAQQAAAAAAAAASAKSGTPVATPVSPSAAAGGADPAELAALRQQVVLLQSQLARAQAQREVRGPDDAAATGTDADAAVDGAAYVNEEPPSGDDIDVKQLTQQVVRYLQNGAMLTKHSRYGKPHLRFFFINDDCRFVLWKESEKAASSRSVELSTVQRCILGQHTEVFKRGRHSSTKYQIDCSFSLVYPEGGSLRTLDVVAENVTEWEAWIMALAALLPCQPEFGEPRDYRPSPQYAELQGDEAAFCARVHVSPADYLAIKEKAETEFLDMGENMIMAIRGVWTDEHIDYFRASKIFNFLSAREGSSVGPAAVVAAAAAALAADAAAAETVAARKDDGAGVSEVEVALED